jgi:hypothetical protein
MLALGMLIVHVAFETRVIADDVALLHGPSTDESEFTRILGFEYLESAASLGECVVLERTIGPGIPADPTPVGCAYPFLLEDTTPLMSIGYEGVDDTNGAVKLMGVTSED